MGKIAVEDAQISPVALVESQHISIAAGLLQALLKQAVTHQEVERVVGLFTALPATLLAQEPSLQRLYAQALCRSRRPAELLAYLDTLTPPVSPELEAYRDWALLREGRHEEAFGQLEAIPGPTLADPGLCWQTRAEVLFRLGRSWQEAFHQARGYLSGAALGRCLVDEGGLLQSGQRSAARVVWAEALAYLRDDPYYLAWARHSLGMALIRDRPEKTEGHLLEAVRLVRKAVAQEFRARALCGLGAVRRSFGEWEWALSSHREAIRVACERDDHFGSLEVKVNGRPVPINPTGRPGELLVFLLENGGSAGVEHLLDQLYQGNRPQDRKALWETAERLREALGWKGSVQIKGGIYRLDHAAEWIYRDQPPQGAGEFMVGHYANWIQERWGISPWVVWESSENGLRFPARPY